MKKNCVEESRRELTTTCVYNIQSHEIIANRTMFENVVYHITSRLEHGNYGNKISARIPRKNRKRKNEERRARDFLCVDVCFLQQLDV